MVVIKSRSSEKAKPMMSCVVEPGRMSTQNPTRKSCEGALQEMLVRSEGCEGAKVRGRRAFFAISTISHQYIEGS